MKEIYCNGAASEYSCINSMVSSSYGSRSSNEMALLKYSDSEFSVPMTEQPVQKHTDAYMPLAFTLAAAGTLMAMIGKYKKLKNTENQKSDKSYNIAAYVFGASAIVSGVLHYLN